MTASRSRACVFAGFCVIAVGVSAGPAYAQDEASEDTGSNTRSAVGFGMAYFGRSPHTGTLGLVDEFGITLDIRAQTRPIPVLGFNFVGSLGMTNFKRAEDVVNGAIDAGEWTTQAFDDVSTWAGEGDAAGLKFLPAFFAYVGLAVSYLAVPIAILSAPFAASTYGLFGFTMSGHLGTDDLEGFVEAGIGGMGYIHPQHRRLLGAVGPLFGAGFRFKPVGVSSRMMWSPPDGHGHVVGEREDVFVSSLTFDLYL